MAKAKKSSTNNLGSLFFVIGAIIAVIGGLFYPGGTNVTLSSVLILLGLVVGLLNVTMVESREFLLAATSLVVITALGGAVLSQVATIGVYLEGILLALLTLIIPAAIIVALKEVIALAEN